MINQIHYRFSILPCHRIIDEVHFAGFGPICEVKGEASRKNKVIGTIEAEVLKFMPNTVIGNANGVGTSLMIRAAEEAIDSDRDDINEDLKMLLKEDGREFIVTALVVVHYVAMDKKYDDDDHKIEFMRQFLHNASGETSIVAYEPGIGEDNLWARIGFERFHQFVFLATPSQPWIPKTEEQPRLRLVQ